MIAKEQVCLTVQDLTRQLRVLVELNDSCGEARMDTDYAVKGHDRVRSEHEVLTVTLLRFVWIVQHVLLM